MESQVNSPDLIVEVADEEPEEHADKNRGTKIKRTFLQITDMPEVWHESPHPESPRCGTFVLLKAWTIEIFASREETSKPHQHS